MNEHKQRQGRSVSSRGQFAGQHDERLAMIAKETDRKLNQEGHDDISERSHLSDASNNMSFTLTKFGLKSATLLSLFLGLVYGLAVMGAGSVITFMISRTSILDIINRIMGNAMTLTPGTLYLLSALLAIVVSVFAALIIWFKALLYNAGSMAFGGLRITLAKTEDKN
jgi:hypothetical protein